MKLKILVLSLLMLGSFSAYAADHAAAGVTSILTTSGSIEISNRADYDIAYRVSGIFEGFVYGVKAGEKDLYMFKGHDDSHVRFEIARCTKMSITGGACQEYEGLQTCLGDDFTTFRRYNFIDVTDEYSCDLMHSYNW
jgi:hypothetical protein